MKTNAHLQMKLKSTFTFARSQLGNFPIQTNLYFQLFTNQHNL